MRSSESRMVSSPGRDGAPTSPRAGQSASYASRSPAASRNSGGQRFYMQHRRQGSNTSVDSASHFIDHRAQPHSLSTSQGASLMRHASRLRQASQSGAPGFSSSSGGARNAADLVDEEAIADEPSGMHVDAIAAPASQGREPSQMPRSHDDHNNSTHTPHTMSRRPSALEDDVCFPMDARSSPQQRPVNFPTDYPDDARDYEEVYDESEQPRNAAGNFPPGFPWTFDMGLLEDFAQEERDTYSANRPDALEAGGLRNRSRGIGQSNIPGETAGLRPGTRNDAEYGISPDSDDATFYSRRPRKHVVGAGGPPDGAAADRSRPTPDTVQKTGRYQRKLAMFESGGSAPPPPDIYGSRNADANTPLLGRENKPVTSSALPTYHAARSEGDNYDSESRAKLNRSYSQPNTGFPGRMNKRGGPGPYSLQNGGLGAPTPADRPYRFTFYSNALPSTIHARHLSELPAKGQTFEELFSGMTPGALGGEERGRSNKDISPSGTTAAGGEDGATAGSAGRNGAGSKPDPSQVGSNLQTSALSAQLAARGPNSVLPGRKEGSTAPPSRTQTPVGGTRSSHSSVHVPNPNLAISRTNTVNTTVPGHTAAAAQASAGRTMPGGGIRMDQDPEANTWWLDVLSPTDQEMKLLSRVFGIHPLTTEDILMEETREKIELFRNYYLVCFRSFDQDPYSPTYLEPLNMYIIVFREGTLSFHFRATPHPQNVRRRIKQLKDYINVTSDWISYALIDDITDAFGPLIQSIEYEVDSIDELVLILKDVEQSDMLRRIGACRKKVMGLLRLMGNKADVVKGLAKRCNENWSVAPKSDIGLYLSDIQDHLITMTQNLSHFEKILSRSHSNYLAQISIEMTEANNRANDVLSKLTALGTVIVPLNIITGMWGMNVNVPGQGVENLHWFFGLLAAMVVIAVVGYTAAVRYLRQP